MAFKAAELRIIGLHPIIEIDLDLLRRQRKQDIALPGIKLLDLPGRHPRSLSSLVVFCAGGGVPADAERFLRSAIRSSLDRELAKIVVQHYAHRVGRGR